MTTAGTTLTTTTTISTDEINSRQPPTVAEVTAAASRSPTLFSLNSKYQKRYYLAAHRRVVNVLTSNSAFLIFDVLVV